MLLKDELSAFADADAADEPVVNGQLPTRLRLLCVGPREPSWVGLTLQLDAEGGIEPQFRWVSSATEALTLLRDDSFDAVLIAAASADSRTNPFAEAASLVKAIREWLRRPTCAVGTVHLGCRLARLVPRGMRAAAIISVMGFACTGFRAQTGHLSQRANSAKPAARNCTNQTDGSRARRSRTFTQPAAPHHR